MKRALAITMTLALLGSLLFMGFAGTAAAGSHDTVDDKEYNDKADEKHDDVKDDKADDKADDKKHDDVKDDKADDKADDKKHDDVKDDKADDKADDKKHDDVKDDKADDKADDKKDDRMAAGDDIALIDQYADAETNQKQDVSQSNHLTQGDNYADAYYGTANAGNFAEQNNANAQLGASNAINAASIAQ
jgi:hypothetical protein